MAGKRRKPRMWVLLVVGATLAGIIAIYASVPPPTVLTVSVVDDSTAAPLAGAQVTARLPGQEPLPVVTTGEDGLARFEFFEGQDGYRVQVQKVDYDLWSIDGVAIANEQETVLPAPLVHNPGGRYFVGLEGARVVQGDVASLMRIQTIILPVPSESPVRYLRLHPVLDLLYVVAGVQGQILSSLTGATLTTFDIQATEIDSLELSADGRYVLVTGLSESDPDNDAARQHLWFLNAESGALISDTILSRAEPPVPLAWQPDGVDTALLLAMQPDIDRGLSSSKPRGGLDNIAFRAGGYPDRVNLSMSGDYLVTWISMAYSAERGEYLDSLVMLSTDSGLAVYQDVAPGVVALAISPVAEELFVLNEDLGTLTLIDLTGQGRQGLVPVGKQPVALTVSGDGARLYVADRGGPALIVVDAAAMRVVGSIPLPAPPLSLAVR